MTTNYTSSDALVYVHERLQGELDGIHNDLAHHYGVEHIDGEEYLPEPLSKVMSRLYGLMGEITDLTVEVGPYGRTTDGVLMRPVRYSTGAEIYPEKVLTRRAGQGEEQTETVTTPTPVNPANAVVEVA